MNEVVTIIVEMLEVAAQTMGTVTLLTVVLVGMGHGMMKRSLPELRRPKLDGIAYLRIFVGGKCITAAGISLIPASLIAYFVNLRLFGGNYLYWNFAFSWLLMFWIAMRRYNSWQEKTFDEARVPKSVRGTS